AEERGAGRADRGGAGGGPGKEARPGRAHQDQQARAHAGRSPGEDVRPRPRVCRASPSPRGRDRFGRQAPESGRSGRGHRMTGDLLLALLGPTASGKTEASLSLAEELGAEIVWVDSMLVYRGMDVGTAKPTIEQRARVPHHLLDLADPTERFSVARFQALAREAVSDIRDRGHRALLVGGGGLYYRAVVDGLRFPGTLPSARSSLEKEAARVGPEALHRQLAEVDPVAARRIHPRNVRRTIRALEVRAITGAVFSAGYQDWDRYPSDAVR